MWINLLLACTSKIRDADALEGTWVAIDSAQTRGLVVESFETNAPPDHTYSLYLYPTGAAPIEVQNGLLSVVDNQLIYDVAFDIEPLNIGEQFASSLERISRDAIRIQDRLYERADGLPQQEALARQLRWGSNISSGFANRIRAGADDRISVYTEAAGELSQVRVFDANGAEQIQVTTTSDLHHPIDDHLLLAGNGARLARLRADGSTAWSIPDDGSIPLDLEVRGGTVVLLVHDGTGLVVLQIDGATGAVRGTTPIGAGASGPDLSHVVPLAGGAFVVSWSVVGEQAGPDGPIGRAGANGLAVAAYEADGQRRWRRWIGPDADFALFHAVEGPDQQVVFAGGVAGRLNLGEDAIEIDPSLGNEALANVVFALDQSDGRLRWSRLSLDDVDDNGRIAVASRDDGRLTVVSTVQTPVDVGGAVGILSPTSDPIPGEVLAVTTLDACGEAVAADTYTECNCTFEDPPGRVRAWGATFLPSGDLALGLSMGGYYRFSSSPPGGSGTTPVDVGEGGAVVVLPGPSVLTVPPDCAPPVLPTPTLSIQLTGAGSVEAGTQACDQDCTIEGELFGSITLNASPDPGYRFEQWRGSCQGTGPCVVHFDDTSQPVEAVFTESAITGLWSITGDASLALVDAVVAAGPTGDVVLATRVQGTLEVNGQTVLTDSTGLPGLVIAVEPTGTVRFTTRLDPPGQGGTSARGLLMRPDGGVLLTTNTGRLVSLAPDGSVRLDATPPLGELTGLAVDDSGQIGVVSGGSFAGLDDAGAVQWVLPTSALQVQDWVSQVDGFAALVRWTQPAMVGDVALLGSGRAVVDISATGVLRSATPLDAAAPALGFSQFFGLLQRGSDDGLWLVGDRTRDPAAPPGQVYAEPIATDGTRRGPAVSTPLPTSLLLTTAPMLPLGDVWAQPTVAQPGQIVPGFVLPNQGAEDWLIALVDSTGVLNIEPGGGPGADRWLIASSDGDTLVALGISEQGADFGGQVLPPGYLLAVFQR